MSTDVQAIQREQGAEFADVDGRALPQRFRGLLQEWRAVREGCGVIDAGFRSLLRARGADRVPFLHGMLSNDVMGLREGEGLRAALLTVQARVVADLFVYSLADEVWLDLPQARLAAVHEALERYLVADDVELVVNDHVVPLACVEGPHAARTLMAVMGESAGDLRALAHRAVPFDGSALRVARVSHTGEEGFTVFGERAIAASLWKRLCAAGAEPVGMDALRLLRVEAGIPWYGPDMDESYLAPEAGLDEAISYKKGCYLGQEVVERVASRGQIRRKLVGLVCDGDVVPAAGTKLLRDGVEAGRITSAVRSPGRGRVVALGYAARGHWDVGTVLYLDGGDGASSVRVAELPFVSRGTERHGAA